MGKFYFRIIAISSLFIFITCSSATLGPFYNERDFYTDTRNKVFFYRPKCLLGCAAVLPIYIRDEIIYPIYNGSFFQLTTERDEITVSSNTSSLTKGNTYKIYLKEKDTFIKCTISISGLNLEKVPKEKALNEIALCRIIDIHALGDSVDFSSCF